MSKTPYQYDEGVLRERLVLLQRFARVLFACACAERLMPAAEWCCRRTGSSIFLLAREALDVAWSLGVSDSLPIEEVEALRERLEATVSCDDVGPVPCSALTENAVAAIAYALRIWSVDDPQQAVWAARQLYEAADSIVQQGSAVQTYVEDIDKEGPVQQVLGELDSLFDDLLHPDPPLLRSRARVYGRTFLGLLTDDHGLAG